jgi:hypothetical protein
MTVDYGQPVSARSCILALPLLIAAWPACAQPQDEQLWVQVNTTIPVAKGLRVTAEQIARVGDRPGGLYETEIGALLRYKLSDKVELGFGYRHIAGYHGNLAPDEERLRQQLIANLGQFLIRLRVDDRFNPRGDEIGFRFRPLLRFSKPLNDKGLGMFVMHESFFLVNNTAWGQRRGYERMRNAVGLTLPLFKGVSSDVAYLNQYRFARGGAQAQMAHALSVVVNVSLKRWR